MTDYYGHPVGVLENADLRLEYLTDMGPRLARLFVKGHKKNLLGEFPHSNWDTFAGSYQLLGGHRLWAAPEQPGFSYQSDEIGLRVTQAERSVTLTWEPEATDALAKQVQVTLGTGSKVSIRHTVTNRFAHKVRLAPWGITCFALGGVSYLPTGNGSGFQPDRNLNIWPYSKWDDERLHLQPSGIRIDARPQLPALKVGLFSSVGQAAYFKDVVLFVKTFPTERGDYADQGSNVECYCSDLLIELETLGKLVELQPGKSTSFEETWEIFTGAEAEQKLQEMFPPSS